MLLSTLFLAIISGLVPLSASSAIPSADDGPNKPIAYGGPKKALYFLQNDPTGSSVVAIELGAQGMLSSSSIVIQTGGKGAQALNATNDAPLGPDSLLSQSAVEVGDDYLFTVNAGSDTVSMFKINPSDPTHLMSVGKPAPSLGDFPMSVTYSSRLKQACVLNGGAKAGVACYKVDEKNGLFPLDTALRLIPGFEQSTPPLGPPNTASQVSFAPSSRFLIAIAKGNMTTPGVIAAYPVQDGQVSTKPVVSRIPDLKTNFGSVFLQPYSRLFMTDGDTGGASLFANPRSLEMKQVAVANANSSLKASCWANWSPELDRVYAIGSGKPTMASVDAQTGALKGIVNFDKSFMGAFDTVIDGTKAYFLAATPQIAVIDLASAKDGGSAETIQSLDLSGDGTAGVGNRTFWEGLAMYPNKGSNPSKGL